MKSFYNSIYLSPHLDDAILSCGGQIYNQIQSGQSILVATIAAGDPAGSGISTFAQSLHQRWQTPAAVVSIRRKEDTRACEELGADFVHWQLLDCIYRQDPQTGQHMYPTEESLFGAIQPGDLMTGQLLGRLISDLPRYEQLVVPLAVGKHVDHQLCRRAAEEVIGAAHLTYYEDYPYAQSSTTQAAKILEIRGWQSSIISLSETAIANKLMAIACYESQLSSFFEGKVDMANQIRSYHKMIGGERLWHLKLHRI